MKHLGVTLGALVAFGALLGAPALPQDVPLDEAAVQAKVDEAMGPLAASFHEVDETTSSNGITTVEHDYRRGDDHRYVYDTGPLHSEEGKLKGEPWYMNANGQVVIDDPDVLRGEGDREKPKAVVTRVQTPVTGYLIARLDSQGHGVKEYVDGVTWQMVRRERITGDGPVIATYDDVRADHGRTFPHHIHIDSRPSHVTSDLKVIVYEPGDVTDAELAIPNPRRRLVEFPAGAQPVEIPSRFSGTQVFVRVMVNGRGLDFTLDTGASGITIDSTVAGELGLKQFGREFAAAAGQYETANTVIREMHVGSLVMHDVAVQVIPHGWQEGEDVKNVGLLGFDFLAELGVTIDYEHHRVTVVPGADFQPPTGPFAIPLDVRIGSGQPRVSVAVNGATGDRFILDTGGDGSFIITDYFARHHPEAFKNQTPYGSLRQFRGIGGVFSVRAYKMSSVKLARLNLLDWVGYRILSRAYGSDEGDGIIGAEFLQLFTVSLDYVNSRVYLVPNADGRAAMGIK